MSIESELERISSAKTAIISAINEQLNGETVPSGIKVEGLAAYIISACDIQYNLGLGGGGQGGGSGLTASGGTADFENLNGSWIEAGTTTVQGTTAPYYSKTVGNNTYYLTRAYSGYYEEIVWAITSYNLSSEATNWTANLYDGSMAYVSSSASSPVGLSFITTNASGVSPSFVAGSGGQEGESSSSSASGGGQGGGTSYVVSGPYMDNIQGTYAPYNTSGYGGTQTYKLVDGDCYMYRFCEDEPGWCIREGGIGDIEVPGGGTPSGTLIFIWDSSTTPPIGMWSDGFSVATA